MADDEGTESTKYKGVWFWNNKWWFVDETENFVGPYNDEEEANAALARYEP